MKVLITGGTGTLGRALTKKITKNLSNFLDGNISKLIIYSRDEYKQSLMQQEFRDEILRFFIGDVRDENRLCQAFEGVDYVIHAAALKQIPTIEYNPTEAIKTNIDGTMNVINACLKTGVRRAVLISTDKACRPVNLYGATKLAAEKLFRAANAYNKTTFSVVRYGNVIASRGSVIELFLKLKSQGIKEFPITDLAMTRFWISEDEAVDLVKCSLSEGDKKIYTPYPAAMKMTDIAKAIQPDCQFKVIGIRPGEKLHEDLLCLEDGMGIAYKSCDCLTMTKEEFLEKLNG